MKMNLLPKAVNSSVFHELKGKKTLNTAPSKLSGVPFQAY